MLRMKSFFYIQGYRCMTSILAGYMIAAFIKLTILGILCTKSLVLLILMPLSNPAFIACVTVCSNSISEGKLHVNYFNSMNYFPPFSQLTFSSHVSGS